MLNRLLVLGCLATAVALAQSGRSEGGANGRGEDMGVRMTFTQSRLDRLGDQLKLNKDQKKDVRTAMDEAQKEATPLRALMAKSRLAIGEAVASGKGKAEIDQAVKAAADLEAQMASIELHAFAKIVVCLEQDQKEQGIRGMFSFVRGVFNSKNWNDPESGR